MDTIFYNHRGCVCITYSRDCSVSRHSNRRELNQGGQYCTAIVINILHCGLKYKYSHMLHYAMYTVYRTYLLTIVLNSKTKLFTYITCDC